MELCSITPLKNADLMYENKYVMLLAHLSQESSLYRDLARNSDRYKIMDNSIIELGSAFTMESLIEQATACRADEIILPDVFRDGSATVAKAKESIQWLKDNNLLGRFKLMAVCHSDNKVDFLDTFKKLCAIPEIDAIGFPKVLSEWMVSRARAADYYTKYTDKQIHLLGCWDSMAEIKDLPKGSKVRSMDTCLPALLSIYGLGAFDSRQGKTIDLEQAEINLDKYRDIMDSINKVLC